MDKSEIVSRNKDAFPYESMNFHLLVAWQKGTEEEKLDLERKYPDLFKDCECKWRSYSDMGGVANGYYWHCNEILVCCDGSWKHADSDRDFDFLNEVSDSSRQFYGPIKPQRNEPKSTEIRSDEPLA